MVRIVVDTGVFFRPDAVERLLESPVPVIVPATVFMERARQLRKRGTRPEEWRDALLASGFVVEAFGPEQALRLAVHLERDDLWKRMYRDAMIGGHVQPGDVLWTTDPKDFLALGLDAHQIVAL